MTDPLKNQENELLQLRDEIDEIDQQLHLLFNQRALCAQRVAQVKEKYQGIEDAVFYRPEREAQVLRKVMARNQGPLEDKAVAQLFREVMSVCLAHEKPLQVAYLGPAGAFAQLASHKHFGASAMTIPVNSLDHVFKEVQNSSVNYGVVPIENSSQGIACLTIDLLKRYQLNICGEVELSIELHLLSNEKLALSDVKAVYALNETLSQCAGWLDQHCASAKRKTVDSLALAIQLIESEEGAVVIAGDGVVDHRWHLVAQNISNNNEHKARFLILGKQKITPSGLDKTTVLVATLDKPGALAALLAPFRESQISLSRIDTHTGGSALGSDCSVFYIDFEGHSSDEKVAKVLQQLAENSVEIKMLGSYPRAVL
ncbi:MAG: chorismate mutase [Oceanospirillaceae bacterium]|nr:chorismate mutase [Oceanospirillaceae bacterium]